MSKTLFDAPLGPPTVTKDDFFDKLDDVVVENSVLGDEVVGTITEWVNEYNQISSEVKKMKEAIDAFNTFMGDTPMFGLRDDNELYYWIKSHLIEPKEKGSLDEKKGPLTYAIMNLVEKKWNVKLVQEDMLNRIDFTSVVAVLDYIAEHINFGDTENIVESQKLDAFYQQWKNIHEPFIIKGKKISVNDAIWFSKWDFDDQRFPNQQVKKMETLEELLIVYHEKRTDVHYSNIQSVFSSYHTGRGNALLFEKNGDDSDLDHNYETLISTKLFKNGKFEMVFGSNKVAQEFFDEYITKAMVEWEKMS